MNEADKRIPFEQEEESGVLLPRPPDSLIKRWLWRLRNATASNRDREGPDQLPLRRQRFLLAVFILLGLTSMVLLLLWNYKCIFIDRLCEGQEGSSVFPVFGGKVPAPTKDGQA